MSAISIAVQTYGVALNGEAVADQFRLESDGDVVVVDHFAGKVGICKGFRQITGCCEDVFVISLKQFCRLRNYHNFPKMGYHFWHKTTGIDYVEEANFTFCILAKISRKSGSKVR